MSKLESEDVRKEAEGRWFSILTKLGGNDLREALANVGKHVECPRHKSKSGDGFRLFKDVHTSGGGVCNTCGFKPDGFTLLMWLKGWNFPETLEEVAKALGMDVNVRGARNRQVEPIDMPVVAEEEYHPAEDERIRGDLRRVWGECELLTHPSAKPVEQFLEKRGLSIDIWQRYPEVIRFHPGLPCWGRDPKTKELRLFGTFPAHVARFFDKEGRPASLHRTFLTLDGDKAPVPQPRKMMERPSDRPLSGGFTPIGPAQNGFLGLAEGMETALAVTMATGMTCWASTSWAYMQKFQPPPGVHTMIIWADKDTSGAGEEFAQKAKLHLWQQGIRASVELPQIPIPDGKKGVDWNNVYEMFGVNGFPRRDLGQRLMQQVG
jgi:hypothetical protein